MKLKDIITEIEFEEVSKDPVLYHIAKTNRGYIRLPLSTTEEIPRGFKYTNKKETFLKLIDWVKTRPDHWLDYTPSEYEVYSGAINRDVYVVGAWVVDEIRRKGWWDIFCLVYPPHPLGFLSNDRWTVEREEMYRKWLLPSSVKLVNGLKKQGNVNEIELETDEEDDTFDRRLYLHYTNYGDILNQKLPYKTKVIKSKTTPHKALETFLEKLKVPSEYNFYFFTNEAVVRANEPEDKEDIKQMLKTPVMFIASSYSTLSSDSSKWNDAEYSYVAESYRNSYSVVADMQFNISVRYKSYKGKTI